MRDLLPYDTFSQRGYVSVWIGNVTDDFELDDYIGAGTPFEEDFGFAVSEQDLPEVKVEKEAVAVTDLVAEFSCAGTFSHEVVEAACKLGIVKAKSMAVFYNLKFALNKSNIKPDARMRFLGAFRYWYRDTPEDLIQSRRA